jgi:hypothetical protein
MDNENAHLKQLFAAREKEIGRRREIASALAAKYKKGYTENMGKLFTEIENTIEAIERAIEHEKFMASNETPGKYTNPTMFGRHG